MVYLALLAALLILAVLRPGTPWLGPMLAIVALDYAFNGFGTIAFAAIAATAFVLTFAFHTLRWRHTSSKAECRTGR